MRYVIWGASAVFVTLAWTIYFSYLTPTAALETQDLIEAETAEQFSLFCVHSPEIPLEKHDFCAQVFTLKPQIQGDKYCGPTPKKNIWFFSAIPQRERTDCTIEREQLQRVYTRLKRAGVQMPNSFQDWLNEK
jgi:hypothetical protein